jgi:hypothetical protein
LARYCSGEAKKKKKKEKKKKNNRKVGRTKIKNAKPKMYQLFSALACCRALLPLEVIHFSSFSQTTDQTSPDTRHD